MAGYKIVYSGGSSEIVEKKSRFIANVFPVESEEDAGRIIGETKKKYWDARHNCYAYIIGENPGISKCSDAKAGLAESRVITKEAGKRVILETGYDGIGKIQYIVSQMGLAVIDTRYSDKTEMELAVSLSDTEPFIKKITEATSGQVKINADDNIYFAVIDQKTVIF